MTQPPHTARVTHYVPPELHAVLSALLAAQDGLLFRRPEALLHLL